MKKRKLKSKIDWSSKAVDLLIVIVGITVAFKLNSWKESIASEVESKNYLESFYSENNNNLENLASALEALEVNKENIDTLQQILLSKSYNDKRIKNLSTSMMKLISYSPVTATMENITASGDFELIQNIELRKKIISTYTAYKTTKHFEELLSDYAIEYVTPYFMKNIRFRDLSSIHTDFIKDPEFENIVFGYWVLLNQQINGYKDNLQEVKELNKQLSKRD